MAFLPFSSRAKAWEPIAVSLSRLAPPLNGSTVNPERLANAVGLHLFDAREALADFPEEDRRHLLVDAAGSWSGGVLPVPLPNGRYLCMVNPTHPPRRNRITLMEEVVHIYRKHKPSGLTEVAPGLKVRSYEPEQEAEAYGVGAAVLLPWATFYHAINTGTPIDEIGDKYDVTPQLVEYRIKVTGATHLYRSRCVGGMTPSRNARSARSRG